MSFINGNKTYIGLVLGGILGFVGAQGWMEPDHVAAYAAIVASWTGVAIKHAWDKKNK